MLSLLVGARDPEGGQPLDEAGIRDQVLIFLLAGHGTTASALTFTFHLLGRHLDVQRRMHQEVDDVLSGRAPTVEDITQLQYTTMAIKEAMRLYPSAHGIVRTAPKSDRILGYEIEPGAEVVVSPWATHRHPAFWEEPERFDPERFRPEREALRHRYACFPFGGGPRACIGQYFSMVEATIATAMVMQAFEVTSPTQDFPFVPRITVEPAGPVPCQVAPRSR